MRTILQTFFVLVFFVDFLAAQTPNIVWIISDDLGPEIGCYGYEGVKTPHIDRLAAQGVRYTKAFATSPVCSASRTAIITGAYQTTIGGYHHRTRNIKPLLKPYEPITHAFRKAGYFVSNGYGVATNRKIAKSDFNFQYNSKMLFDGADWSLRKPGQPFFAQIQIKQPHRPFVKSGRDGNRLKIPPFYPEHPLTRADWANYIASIEVLDHKVGEVLDRLDKEGLADNTVVFFFGDHGRPHVRAKQWLYDGGLHVPLIIRWPGKIQANSVDDHLISMIDFAPTTLSIAGLKIPSYMTGCDILSSEPAYAETIFAARDRCGDAIDRIRCLRTKRWKYIRNYYPEKSYSQTSGYKKLQYPVLTLMAVMHAQGQLKGPAKNWFASTRPAEELYDLESDPWEMKNLAENPEYAKTLKGFQTELNQWIITSSDQGGLPEGDANYIQALLAEKKKYYERTMKRRNLNPNLSDRAYLNWWKTELGVE